MEKILEKLKGITKIFGIILLSGAGLLGCLGVLAFLLTALISFYDYSKSNIVAAFQKKSPVVEFYLSDYLPAGSDELKNTKSVRPKSEKQLVAEEIVETVLPKYSAKVDEAMNADIETMKFKDDDEKKEKVDKMKEQAKNNLEQFKSSSIYQVSESLNEIEESDYDDYADGLNDYLSKAEKAGVEVYTNNKTPIQTFGIWSSTPYLKYHKEFIAQNKELKENKKEGATIRGMFDVLKKELLFLYLGLFGVFATMVLILAMNKWVLLKKE